MYILADNRGVNNNNEKFVRAWTIRSSIILRCYKRYKGRDLLGYLKFMFRRSFLESRLDHRLSLRSKPSTGLMKDMSSKIWHRRTVAVTKNVSKK